MDAGELAAMVSAYLEGRGYLRQPQAYGLALLFAAGEEQLDVALLPDQADERGYLAAFEAGMQAALDARQAQPGLRLCLALAFGSTAAGAPASYRRALKKYSNSVVFEDLELGLLLVLAPGDVIQLQPGEVNTFLRNLNRWLAGQGG